MNIDKAVIAFAGFMILVSLTLYLLHSHYWLWLTAFIGFNQLQSSLSGFCPAAFVFKILGLKQGSAFK